MAAFLNYLGQARLYSYLDLLLMSIALHATPRQLAGISCLWFAFLAYLEWKHRDRGRLPVPAAAWLLLASLGLILHPTIGTLVFLGLSWAYTQKKYRPWGWCAPLMRGAQSWTLVASLVGGFSPLAFLAAGLSFVRNLLGDLRDVRKDRAEGRLTLPIQWGIRHDWPHVHLAGVMATSLIWWSLTELALIWLLLVWLVQLATYHWTPR